MAKLSHRRKNKKDTFRRMVCMVRMNYDDDQVCQWDFEESREEGAGQQQGTAAKAIDATMGETIEDKCWVELRVALLAFRQFVAHHV